MSSSCCFPGEDTAEAEQHGDVTSPAEGVHTVLIAIPGTDCNDSINKAQNILQMAVGSVISIATCFGL